MTIHEKLERLMKHSSKCAVSREAGLGASTLGTCLYRRSPISTAVAASLARVLCVDVGWLVDDSRNWPPVRVESAEPMTAA